MLTLSVCVVSRDSSGAPSGWKRLTAFSVVTPARASGLSSACWPICVEPSASSVAGASWPPKLVPSSVTCQVMLNGSSGSSKRSSHVSSSVWSPKRTARTSTLPSPSSPLWTSLTRSARFQFRSGMPL